MVRSDSGIKLNSFFRLISMFSFMKFIQKFIYLLRVFSRISSNPALCGGCVSVSLSSGGIVNDIFQIRKQGVITFLRIFKMKMTVFGIEHVRISYEKSGILYFYSSK